MPAAPARKPPALLGQALLLLLPVAVLTIIGAVSLFRERAAAFQEAREEIRTATTQIADALGPGLEIYQRLPAQTVPILLDAQGALISPPPYPQIPIPGDGSSAGLPLPVLEAIHQDPPAPAAIIEAAFAHPSIITPTIIERYDPTAAARWETEESARATYTGFAARLSPTPPAEPFWSGDTLVCLVPAPAETAATWSLRLIPKDALTTAFHQALATGLLQSRIPEYATPDIAFEPSSPSPTSVPWLPGGAGKLTFSLAITAPEIIQAQFRRRALWLGGTIGVAALAALLGFLYTRRAFLQQQQLNTEKDNFVSSVSHELRAPVASMQIMAESLATDRVTEPEKRHQYYRLIGDECRRLGSLVENVLDFSRLESGRKHFDFEDTDLAALAQATADLMAPQAAKKDITLKTDLSPATASTDPAAIQRALINLIENALTHTPKSGTVTLGCAPTTLWVEDTGAGIPESEHSKIFQRFYRRGSELTRESDGVGIGLSIVQSIAEAHRGSISLTSRPGHGSRFTITLP